MNLEESYIVDSAVNMHSIVSGSKVLPEEKDNKNISPAEAHWLMLTEEDKRNMLIKYANMQDVI